MFLFPVLIEILFVDEYLMAFIALEPQTKVKRVHVFQSIFRRGVTFTTNGASVGLGPLFDGIFPQSNKSLGRFSFVDYVLMCGKRGGSFISFTADIAFDSHSFVNHFHMPLD